MANIQKGEASFTAGGKVYRLVMDFNAFAEAEDAADMGVDDLLKAITPEVDGEGNVTKKPRIKHMGAILYGALKAHQPNISLPDAINLMNDGGEAVGEAIAKALNGAMPKADASAEGKAEVLGPGTGTKPSRTGRQKG
ncbi:hypothetical protein TomMM35A_18620 [Sphingobium sp. TomMM35A]